MRSLTPNAPTHTQSSTSTANSGLHNMRQWPMSRCRNFNRQHTHCCCINFISFANSTLCERGYAEFDFQYCAGVKVKGKSSQRRMENETQSSSGTSTVIMNPGDRAASWPQRQQLPSLGLVHFLGDGHRLSRYASTLMVACKMQTNQ